MKHLKILYPVLFILLLFTCFVACSDDDDYNPFERVTNFDVPTLTADNTIQFEVNVLNASSPVLLNLRGVKVAVDWGDDNIEKDNLLENRGETSDDRNVFQHKFQSAGRYTVKVWSTELTELRLLRSGYDQSENDYVYDKLQFGNCPILESFLVEYLGVSELVFPTISSLNSLCLNYLGNLKKLNISNLRNLESLQVSGMDKLETLDVSDNNRLSHLNCYNQTELTSVQFKNNKSLTLLYLNGCPKLSTIDLKGVPNLVDLNIGSMTLTELDMASLLELQNLSCYNTGVSILDLSKNIALDVLYLSKNKMSILDVSKNINLTKLICINNELTNLDVSTNQKLEEVALINNLLSAQTLDAIFTALPKSKYGTGKSTPPPSYPSIVVYDNPGYADCKLSIIKDKGWVVREKSSIN